MFVKDKTKVTSRVGGIEGQCGDAMATLAGWEERVRRSLEILSVKKEANLSGRDMDAEEVGNGDVDLRWRQFARDDVD